MDKNNWTLQQFNYINWEFLRNAFYHSTTKQKKAFMKITHKKWATNEVKSKWSNRNDNRCIRCNKLHENWKHIFTCQSEHAEDFMQETLQDMNTFLVSSKVSAPFQKAFMSGITSWVNIETVTFPYDPEEFDDTVFLLIHEAFLQKSSVGWDQLFCGRIVNTWFIAHDLYMNQWGLKQSYISQVLGPRLVKHLL